MSVREHPADLLRGLSFDPLPPGWTPIAATVLVKCLDPEGNPFWLLRRTDDVKGEELLGALEVRVELCRQELVQARREADL